MDPRRRTLAADPSQPNVGGQSMIPLPSSAMKKPAMRSSSSQNNLRQSLAPGGYGRMSVAGPGGLNASQQSSQDGSQAAQRRSTMMMSQGHPRGSQQDLGMSGGRGDGGMYGHGRTPSGRGQQAPNTIRRSSSFSSQSRQSLAPQPMIGSTLNKAAPHSTDPREIKTAAYQKLCRDNILAALNVRRCPLSITPKTLISPTQKEFQMLFKWLISEPVQGLDPSFAWGKNFEGDCATILKDMKYPTPDQVGKTALGAPGSPTTWPYILAMLNWMIELAKALEQWQDPEIISDPILTPVDQLPDSTPNIENLLFVDFVKSSFSKWFEFDGAEEFPEEEAKLRERFESMAQSTFEEAERYQTMLNHLQADYQLLVSQPSPLKKLEDIYVERVNDKQKFHEYLSVMGLKMEKLKAANAKVKETIDETNNAIVLLRAERVELEGKVATQNLSPDEVNRMNLERQTLTDTIRDLNNKVAETTKLLNEQEIAVTRRMDDLESFVQDYLQLGYKIGITGPRVEGLPENVDFHIEIDMTPSDLTEVQIVGQRMKDKIRPALQAYGDMIRAEYQKETNTSIGLEDEADRVGNMVDQKKELVKTMEVKYKIANDQAEDAKQKLQAESKEMQDHLAKLEQTVRTMSMSSQQDLLAVESELQRLKVARSEQQHRTNNLREKIVADLSAHTDLMLKTKEHVSQKLMEMTNFAKTRK